MSREYKEVPAGTVIITNGARIVWDGKGYDVLEFFEETTGTEGNKRIFIFDGKPCYVDEVVRITGSMDVTPYESPVLILSDGRVIYHPGNNWEYPGDDMVWTIGDIQEWEDRFAELPQEKINTLSKYADGWDGEATASNIHTFICYYGCDETAMPADWEWAEFSGSVLGIYDEHCITKESQETEAEDEEYCDMCGAALVDDEGITLKETKSYERVIVCRKCFDSDDKYINEQIEEIGELEK